MQGVVEAFRAYLGGFSGVERRVLATAIVCLLAALAAGLVAPYLRSRFARWTRRWVGRRLDDRQGPLALLVEGVPFGAVAVAGLRAFQLVVVGAAGLALLVVWGETGTATSLLGLFRASAPAVGRLALTLALVVGGYVAADVLEEVVEEVVDDRDRIGEHEQHVVYRLAQLGVFAVVAFGGLLVWGVDPAGLFVGAGFLGIVVGLAARQTLGSLVAGLVLMFSRPFEIGDWVEIGDTEGIVTDITIINTRLRNFEGEYVSIPNDRVGNSVVHNRSREGRLRLSVEVGVDYDADPERAASVAREVMAEVDAIVDNPAPEVIPTRFGDSAVVLELRFWIENPSPPRKWRAVRSVVYGVKEAFDREGIPIPFPQRTLSGRAGSAEVPAEMREPEVSADGGD